MRKTTIGVSELWQFSFFVILSVTLVLLPDLALAQNISIGGNAVCDISDSFTGEVATGIGTIAICTVGTMACIGRVQWTTAVVVAVGVSLLFGTTALLSTLATAGGGNITPCT